MTEMYRQNEKAFQYFNVSKCIISCVNNICSNNNNEIFDCLKQLECSLQFITPLLLSNMRFVLQLLPLEVMPRAFGSAD